MLAKITLLLQPSLLSLFQLLFLLLLFGARLLADPLTCWGCAGALFLELGLGRLPTLWVLGGDVAY